MEDKNIKEIIVSYIPERFAEDAGYREGHVRIINPLHECGIAGLHLPDMKIIAGDLAAGGNVECIAGSNCMSHEEKMIRGFVINRKKSSLVERLEAVNAFLPAMDNWAVCDSFCCDTKWVKKIRTDAERKMLWDHLADKAYSGKEFQVRYALIMAMCHYLDDQWMPDVFALLEDIRLDSIESSYRKGKTSRTRTVRLEKRGIFYHVCEEDAGFCQGEKPYYVRMGMAWLLATALAKNPVLTRRYLKNTGLPDDILKLYVRKAKESFRTRYENPF